MSLYNIEILEHALRADGPISRSSLLEDSEISRASATRLLSRMVQEGLLAKQTDGAYLPGPRLQAMVAHGGSVNGLKNKRFAFVSINIGATEPIYHGINDVLAEHGSSCVLHPIGRHFSEVSQQELARNVNADGVFVYTSNPLLPHVAQWLRDSGLSAVHTGFSGFGPCDTVSWDQRHAYTEMTRQMIERFEGRVMFYAYENYLESSHELRTRLDGYREGMQAAGLEPLLHIPDLGFLRGEESGEVLAGKFNAKPGEAVCIMTPDGNQIVRELLLQRLGESSLRPSEIAFCGAKAEAGHEGVSAESLLVPDEPWREVGRIAARRMAARMNGDKSEPQKILIEATLEPQASR